MLGHGGQPSAPECCGADHLGPVAPGFLRSPFQQMLLRLGKLRGPLPLCGELKPCLLFRVAFRKDRYGEPQKSRQITDQVFLPLPVAGRDRDPQLVNLTRGERGTERHHAAPCLTCEA